MAAETHSISRLTFANAERLALAKDLVRALAVAHTNAGLYPLTHPTVAQSLEDAVAAVSRVNGLGLDGVTINIYKRTLFVENQVFPEESVTYRKFVEEVLGRGISALTLALMTLATAQQESAQRLAAKIVDLMEAPW